MKVEEPHGVQTTAHRAYEKTQGIIHDQFHFSTVIQVYSS